METFWLKNPVILFDPKRLKYYMPGPNLTWEEQANALIRFIIYLSLILYLTSNNPLLLIVPPLLMMGVQYYMYQENKLQPFLTNTFGDVESEPSTHIVTDEDQIMESFISRSDPNTKDQNKNHENFTPLHLRNAFHNDKEPLNTVGPRPDLALVRPPPEPKPKEIDCKPATIDNPFGNALPYDTIEKQVNPACPNEFTKDEKFYNKLFHGIDDLFDRNNSQRQFTTNPSSTRINDREAAIQFFYNTPYTEH